MRVKTSSLLVLCLLGAIAIVVIGVARGDATPKSSAGALSVAGRSLLATGALADAGRNDDARRAAPSSQTLRYSFQDASGSQEMQVSFVGKKRIKVAFNRRRTDGCNWNKTWFGRFDQVSELTDDDGETFLVDEYKAEKGQFTCEMLVDIEQGTREHASVSALQECGKICRLDGAAQMKLVK